MKPLVCLILTVWSLLAIPCLAGQASTDSFELVDNSLLETSEGRKLLRYLAECALTDGAQAYAMIGDTRHDFDGALGLAPDWGTRALTQAEARAVSACIFARTNAFGVPVQISMRAYGEALKPVAGFAADAEERARYALFEGAFFGNLFDKVPRAFVCRGDVSRKVEAQLRQLKRICTLPTAMRGPNGYPLSACGFEVLGSCAALAQGLPGDLPAQADPEISISVYLPRAE